LSPLRGKEHQNNLVSEASLPNTSAYKTNLKETKEIEKQVNDLVKKGWVQKILLNFAVPMLVSKKGLGECV